jgi:nicotinate-nucleotide adenylyltransferase
MPSAPSTIGLLGGSFDPIHRAHLALAQAALDELGLAQVRFLPAGQPWQKTGLASAEARAAMVRLAIDSVALASPTAMTLDRRELDRPGATYTIDTLRSVRAQLGPQTGLVLLIGGDQLQRFDTWHGWESILDYAHLGIAPRSGDAVTPTPRLQAWYDAHRAEPSVLQAAAAGSIIEISMPPADVSATEIRQLLRATRSAAVDARLARLLPDAVLDYIRAHRLYASDPVA